MTIHSGFSAPPPEHLAMCSTRNVNQETLIPYSFNPYPVRGGFIGGQKASRSMLQNVDLIQLYVPKDMCQPVWSCKHHNQSLKRGMLPRKTQEQATFKTKKPVLFRPKKHRKNSRRSFEATYLQKLDAAQGQLKLPVHHGLSTIPGNLVDGSSFMDCSPPTHSSIGMSSEDLGACTIPLCGRLLQCQSVQQPVPCSSQCTIVNSPDRCLHAAGLGLSSQEPLFFESFQKVEGVKYPQSDSYEAGTILQDAKPNLQNSFHAPNGFSVFGMNPITSVCQMWAQDLREGRIKS